MSILSAILGGGTAPRAAPPAHDDFWWQTVGLKTKTGVVVSPDIAMRVTTVYRCVAILSQTLATLPLHIFRKLPERKGKEQYDQHPMGEVLRYQPNGWQTSYEFRQMLMGHLCLRGNAYAEIVPGLRGAVDQLLPLHPDRVNVERLTNGRLLYKIRDPETNEERRLVQDEILHLRGLTSDGIRGLSPIEADREAIALALGLEEHGARLIGNGARPSGILTTDKKLGDAAKNKLKAAWGAMHSGLSNVGGTPVLADGLKWQQIGLSSVDAEWLATRRYQVEEICRIFGVPPFMVGHTDKTTSWGSGIEQQLLGFLIFTMRPWLVAWEQAMRRDLIVAKNLYSAEFNVEGLLRGDSKARAEFYASAIQNTWMSPNEVREREGLNPREGGDKYENPNVKPAAGMGHNGGPPLDDKSESQETEE